MQWLLVLGAGSPAHDMRTNPVDLAPLNGSRFSVRVWLNEGPSATSFCTGPPEVYARLGVGSPKQVPHLVCRQSHFCPHGAFLKRVSCLSGVGVYAQLGVGGLWPAPLFMREVISLKDGRYNVTNYT